MKKAVKLAGVFTVAMACSLPIGPAQSAIEPSTRDGLEIASEVFSTSNPKAAFERLSPRDRRSFERVTTLAKVEETTVTTKIPRRASVRTKRLQSRAATVCSVNIYTKRAGKSVAGNTLYTYWQRTQVCAKGSDRIGTIKVTNVGGETSTIGWSYNGYSIAKFDAGWEGRGLAKFKFSFGWGPATQNPTPCAQVRINKSYQTYSTSGSCNLN